jgi:hypothetical protein
MAEGGNGINGLSGKDLWFSLGTLVGGKVSSSASVSDFAKSQILNALNTDKEITLALNVPLYEGRGAPDNFSFACIIE